MFSVVMNFTQNQSKNTIEKPLTVYLIPSSSISDYTMCIIVVKMSLNSSKDNLLMMEVMYFTLQKYLEIRYSVILESRFSDSAFLIPQNFTKCIV